ncbi:PaaI family thioesterase [Brevundimonas sp. AJA228-03]|uniref:PaaI family thioesterase n=1 Tax=Brevundimonas sp. AJA228-03 TaxID=2752515 RepID=UPI001ADFEDB0|nr:PaaI family thioesterase [Brevundimonas sp. AJA228-03]QTN18316.1 PaaI family thioesterase [Brevundimonas sp. AJA228-03]
MSEPVRFKLDPTVDGLELVRRWIAAGDGVGGFLKRLGSHPVEAREGFVRLALNIDPGHANFIGLIHGGVTAALIDMAGGAATMSILKQGQTLVTSDLTMRFLNAAPGTTARLEATGTVTWRDDRKAVVTAEVTTDAGVVVAQGTVGVAIRAAK